MITIIDYGMGNMGSVVQGFRMFTDNVRISSDPASIADSDALVMPGDGAYAMAVKNLRSAGWVEPLKEYIAGGGYFFGICLGFQLLYSSSEEFGHTEGLDVIPGRIIRFPESDLKVPHMGWNSVKLKGSSPFLEGIPDESYFYFIHSFHPAPVSDEWTLGEAEYGLKFPCIAGKGNLIAAQFHPEKSHKWGLKIVENFVKKVNSGK